MASERLHSGPRANGQSQRCQKNDHPVEFSCSFSPGWCGQENPRHLCDRVCHMAARVQWAERRMKDEEAGGAHGPLSKRKEECKA